MKHDNYIEDALLLLATKYNKFLYRTDTGWVVNSPYVSINPLSSSCGRPASNTFPTIKKAIENCIEIICEEAERRAEDCQKQFTVHENVLSDLADYRA